MIKLDALRKAFEAKTWQVLTDAEFTYSKVYPNRSARLDNAKAHVVTGFLPGQTQSQEMGGSEALGLRDGVFMVTFSLPGNSDVSQAWDMAEVVEAAFRRAKVETDDCHAWCDEPYTENRGNDPNGRFLVSTHIPWTAAHN